MAINLCNVTCVVFSLSGSVDLSGHILCGFYVLVSLLVYSVSSLMNQKGRIVGSLVHEDRNVCGNLLLCEKQLLCVNHLLGKVYLIP